MPLPEQEAGGSGKTLPKDSCDLQCLQVCRERESRLRAGPDCGLKQAVKVPDLFLAEDGQDPHFPYINHWTALATAGPAESSTRIRKRGSLSAPTHRHPNPRYQRWWWAEFWSRDLLILMLPPQICSLPMAKGILKI